MSHRNECECLNCRSGSRPKPRQVDFAIPHTAESLAIRLSFTGDAEGSVRTRRDAVLEDRDVSEEGLCWRGAGAEFLRVTRLFCGWLPTSSASERGRFDAIAQ